MRAAAWRRRALLRRRQVDPWMLGGGVLLLGLLVSAGKIALLFFAACGLYLALLRPRSRRTLPQPYCALLAGWALWQIGLSLARGEPLVGNRTLSYAGIELALAFLPAGLCLVRDPAGAIANGARVCLILLCLVAPAAFLLGEARVGLGGNEAIFAFVIGVVALAARLQARQPLRYLPNGRAWSYLVIVPVLLSGTRAAFGIVILVLLADAAQIALRYRAAWRTRRGAVPIALAAAMAVLIGLGALVENRIQAGVAEVETFQRTGIAAGSVDTRLVMWSAGWQVFREHPLLGVGGTNRMEAAGEKAGPNGFMVTYYQHLHNAFLDEVLSSGLVGLALMLGVFAAFLGLVWRASALPRVRSTALLLTGFTFIFGLFHGVLLNEWTLIVLFGTMGAMAEAARRAGARGR